MHLHSHCINIYCLHIQKYTTTNRVYSIRLRMHLETVYHYKKKLHKTAPEIDNKLILNVPCV